MELAREIEAMEPFGEGNPRPVLLMRDASQRYKVYGRGEKPRQIYRLFGKGTGDLCAF